MRISELSRRSGVPIATIKYYLREGLLPAGELTSATQAQYADEHLDRLGLIRALLGPARLSVAAVRHVLAVVDDPPQSPLELLGRAFAALATEAEPAEGLGPVQRLVDRMGWQVAEGSPALSDLARAIAAIEQGQLALIAGGLDRYAEAMQQLATDEVDSVPSGSPEAAVRQAVLGTILIEPLLVALRRLALQSAATRRFG